jgi:hypothetical protein
MFELAQAIEQLAATAREGKTTPEDMKDGTFLITEGHRRKAALELIQKRTKKPQFARCVIENKITDEERLVKRAAIDAQMRNLTPFERDILWEKIWKTGKYTEQEFTKTIGTPQREVKNFFDRQSLSPDLKKLLIGPDKNKSGLLQETLSLEPKRRSMILKYAAKTGIGAMGLRQQVKELKSSSDVVIKSFTDEEINLDQVKQLNKMKESDQVIAIENIKLSKKVIANIPKLVANVKTTILKPIEKNKITAQEFVNKLHSEMSNTGNQIRIIKGVIEEMDEKNSHQYLSDKIKKDLAETLNSLVEDINDALELMKSTEKKWRGK